MIGLLKALGIVKVAVAATALTVATAFAAQGALPDASSGGQAHAAAASANAQTPDGAGQTASGKDVAALTTRLAANKARLLAGLEAVLTRLEANPNANQHAKDALQRVIDRLARDIGLNRATRAVSDPGAGTPDLPSQTTDHPTGDDHPGKP